MVVVVASNGAVAKRVFNFERRLDPGLLEWASSYLNERLTGLALGARMTGDRISDPELSAPEASFLTEIGAAFTDLERRAGEDLYVDGAARLLSGARARPARGGVADERARGPRQPPAGPSLGA